MQKLTVLLFFLALCSGPLLAQKQWDGTWSGVPNDLIIKDGKVKLGEGSLQRRCDPVVKVTKMTATTLQGTYNFRTFREKGTFVLTRKGDTFTGRFSPGTLTENWTGQRKATEPRRASTTTKKPSKKSSDASQKERWKPGSETTHQVRVASYEAPEIKLKGFRSDAKVTNFFEAYAQLLQVISLSRSLNSGIKMGNKVATKAEAELLAKRLKTAVSSANAAGAELKINIPTSPADLVIGGAGNLAAITSKCVDAGKRLQEKLIPQGADVTADVKIEHLGWTCAIWQKRLPDGNWVDVGVRVKIAPRLKKVTRQRITVKAMTGPKDFDRLANQISTLTKQLGGYEAKAKILGLRRNKGCPEAHKALKQSAPTDADPDQWWYDAMKKIAEEYDAKMKPLETRLLSLEKKLKANREAKSRWERELTRSPERRQQRQSLAQQLAAQQKELRSVKQMLTNLELNKLGPNDPPYRRASERLKRAQAAVRKTKEKLGKVDTLTSSEMAKSKQFDRTHFTLDVEFTRIETQLKRLKTERAQREASLKRPG